MAAYSAGFRVAPITAIIVLLSASGAALGPLGFATDRVLEVGLGCAIGLLVSVLVVPARASRSVLETASEVTRLLAEQLEAMAVPGDQAQANLSALAVRTRKSLNRLETLVGEAARERRSRLTDMPDPEPLLRTLMRLRHDMVMLRRAVGEPGVEVLREHPAQAWSHAAGTGVEILRNLADALSAGQPPERSDAMADAIGEYRAAIDEMRRSKRTRIFRPIRSGGYSAPGSRWSSSAAISTIWSSGSGISPPTSNVSEKTPLTPGDPPMSGIAI